MAKIEFNALSKKLGIAKRHIRRLVYMPKATLRYTEEIKGGKRTQYFEEDEVLALLAKSTKK